MAYSQDGPELAALNNFKVEDLKVKWQKVFERDTLGMRRGILEAKSLKLIERSVDGVFLDVVNLPLGKRGTNTCNGRAKIEFKEGKYPCYDLGYQLECRIGWSDNVICFGWRIC